MPRKVGNSGRSTAVLSGIRANLRSTNSNDDNGRPSSYDEFLSQQKQAEKDRKTAIRAESTLKYGGGFGRKLLYGATKSLVGGKAAAAISQKFRDKGATEKAYQTIVENEKKSADRGGIIRDSRLERIDASNEIGNDSVEEILDQNTEILDIIDEVSESVDKLLDKQEETLSIISKSNFLDGKKIEEQDEEMLEKLPRDPEIIKEAVKKARGRGERRVEEKRQPKSYEEYLSVNKNLSKAEKTLRYGGTGFGRKALFGITKAIAGEGVALKVASLGRNKKQTEEAYQTIQNDGYAPPVAAEEQQKVNELTADDTESQKAAEMALKSKNDAELAEKNEEWNKDVIERLDRIEASTGGGGSSIVDLIIAAIPLALAGLYAQFKIIKAGIDFVKNSVGKIGEAIGKKIAELFGKLKGFWPFGSDDSDSQPETPSRGDRRARGGKTKPKPSPTSKPAPAPTTTSTTTTEPTTEQKNSDRKARGAKPKGTSTSTKPRPAQPRDSRGRFISATPTAERLGARSSAKAAGKGLLKSAVKKIPVVGLVAGLGFAASRAMSGDFVGAGLEASSGIASTLPGLGTAASVGIDATLAARDAGVIGGATEPAKTEERPAAEPLPPPVAVSQAKPQENLEDILDPEKIVKDWVKIDGAYRDDKTGFIILPDSESLPLMNPNNSTDERLQNSSRSLEETQEENITESQGKPQTVVVNGAAPAPAPPMSPPPSSSGDGSTIIITRNIELSQSAYTASIFNHPVIHPGTFAF